MSTSPTMPILPEMDVDPEAVPSGFTYMRTRNRLHAFTLVHEEFAKANITRAELARRLGRGADRVSRLLGAPGNWTLDTVSDLLFAISGAEVRYAVHHPRQKATVPGVIGPARGHSPKALPPAQIFDFPVVNRNAHLPIAPIRNVTVPAVVGQASVNPILASV